jgi:hypothetical protein
VDLRRGADGSGVEELVGSWVEKLFSSGVEGRGEGATVGCRGEGEGGG